MAGAGFGLVVELLVLGAGGKVDGGSAWGAVGDGDEVGEGGVELELFGVGGGATWAVDGGVRSGK